MTEYLAVALVLIFGYFCIPVLIDIFAYMVEFELRKSPMMGKLIDWVKFEFERIKKL